MNKKHGAPKDGTVIASPQRNENGPKGIRFDFLGKTRTRDPEPAPPFVVATNGRFLPVEAYSPELGDILIVA